MLSTFQRYMLLASKLMINHSENLNKKNCTGDKKYFSSHCFPLASYAMNIQYCDSLIISKCEV
jgi:hypothetical protein